jgi:hypothetical protein
MQSPTKFLLPISLLGESSPYSECLLLHLILEKEFAMRIGIRDIVIGKMSIFLGQGVIDGGVFSQAPPPLNIPVRCSELVQVRYSWSEGYFPSDFKGVWLAEKR